MIVMKFGGTSVGGAEEIRKVAGIVKANAGKKPVVIVSAVKGITDKLIGLALSPSIDERKELLGSIIRNHHAILELLSIDKDLLEEDLRELSSAANNLAQSPDSKVLDLLQSFGERMSSKIVAAHLNSIGVKARSFNSWEIGFLTDDEFGNAEPLPKSYKNIEGIIGSLSIIPVITGFIGKTRQGDITTLGRGGSDYLASIIGSAVNATEIQIWTDVDGIMSADPKIVRNAKVLSRISFSEAAELAYFGAKFLHPKTIWPAVKKDIPVRVLNTFNPECSGTLILAESGKNSQIVKAIAVKKGVIRIHVDSKRMLGAHGFLARLFDVFSKYRKSVDVISTSEVSVSMTVDSEKDIDAIASDLRGIADVEVSRGKAVICVIGEGMRGSVGVAGRILSVVDEDKICVEMISQGASGVNLTFVVDVKHADKVVNSLHEEYYRVAV